MGHHGTSTKTRFTLACDATGFTDVPTIGKQTWHRHVFERRRSQKVTHGLALKRHRYNNSDVHPGHDVDWLSLVESP